MRNYVLKYHLPDSSSEENLLGQLKKKFPRNRIIIENNLKYFSFAERALAGVKDVLQEVIESLPVTDNDYLALYYTRDEEPDDIKRLMVFGTSNLIDKDLKKVSQTVHERILAELLEFDFIRSS